MAKKDDKITSATPAEQLEAELAQQRRLLYDLRSQAVTEKLEDPSQLRKARRRIAQIMTARRAQQLASQKAKA